MHSHDLHKDGWSRRNLLARSAALLAGGAVGGIVTAAARAAAGSETPAEAPPLPYMMMAHAAAGFGGHGTLCGALAGVSTIINMVTFGEKRDEYLQNNQIVDRLFYWYAEQNFPPTRFDDLSPMPGQVQVKAMSPLCHTSVSKWAMAAGSQIKEDAKIERCAKVADEVAYTVTMALNEYFDGKWVAPVWKPSEDVAHCVKCHGPDTATQRARKWNQQGHMDCLMCHTDHTA